MLTPRLRSAEFFAQPGHHIFNFELADRTGRVWYLPIVTANGGDGERAVFDRAHDNLVEFLKIALETAEAMRDARMRSRSPVTDESPD